MSLILILLKIYCKKFKRKNSFYEFDLKKNLQYKDICSIYRNDKRLADKYEKKNESMYRLKYWDVARHHYRIKILNIDYFDKPTFVSKLKDIEKTFDEKFGHEPYTKEIIIKSVNLVFIKNWNKDLEDFLKSREYYGGIIFFIVNKKAYTQGIIKMGDNAGLHYNYTLWLLDLFQ